VTVLADLGDQHARPAAVLGGEGLHSPCSVFHSASSLKDVPYTGDRLDLRVVRPQTFSSAEEISPTVARRAPLRWPAPAVARAALGGCGERVERFAGPASRFALICLSRATCDSRAAVLSISRVSISGSWSRRNC
jgi:hypothetical protein